MNARELALYIIRKKGFDEADWHLCKAVAYRVVQAAHAREAARVYSAGGEGGECGSVVHRGHAGFALGI